MNLKALLNSIKTWVSRLLANLLITLIVGLRPLLGPACCKFSVSCTDFAVLKLKEGPLLHAIWEIAKRLARCQPFYRPKNFN
jgi:putative component of membrane protein insertase Oxa1/YidC/SpoIIIJ protein YidD